MFHEDCLAGRMRRKNVDIMCSARSDRLVCPVAGETVLSETDAHATALDDESYRIPIRTGEAGDCEIMPLSKITKNDDCAFSVP